MIHLHNQHYDNLCCLTNALETKKNYTQVIRQTIEYR